MRQLAELSGIGKAALRDFELLGVHSVPKLAQCDADELYHRLCELTGQRQDPCVHDVLRCAIEQARDPELEPEKRKWWYWSKVRKAQGPVL